MQTANDALLDSSIRHAHAIERFKNGEVRRILSMLNRDVYPALVDELRVRLSRISSKGYDRGVETTKRLRDMIAALDSMIVDGMALAEDRTVMSMHGLAGVEASAAVKQIEKSLVVEWNMTLPSPETLRALVTSKPFNGAILGEHFETMTRATQGNLRRALNIGLTAGETTDQIVQRVQGTAALKYRDGTIDQSRRSVQNIVRTATNHVSSQAREATYSENSDIVKGVRWVSTLDTRTTPICQMRDGEVYAPSEGPRPPAHYGCRSTTTPVLKSWKELGIAAADAPAGTRASLTGEVPGDLTYGEWIKRQSGHVQDEALGPARAALLRSGDVSFDSFTDDRGELLTLADLSRVEGLD